MKKKLFVAALIVLMLSIVGYGTYAYTTVEEREVNVITSGGVDITLVEKREDGKPFPEDGVHGVVPGVTESKVVTVKNSGGHRAWVRVKVDKTITLAEGVVGKPDLTLVTMDYNIGAWEYRDGFWYYLKPLEPGRTTEALFKNVSFDPKMDNLYQGSVAQVKVSAYATQTANNGTTVWEASGWPAETK